MALLLQKLVSTWKFWTQWLTIIALALAISFLYSSPLNAKTELLIKYLIAKAKKFESQERLPEETIIDPGEVNIIIIGMGRLGTGAYDEFVEQGMDKIVGLDLDDSIVQRHRKREEMR